MLLIFWWESTESLILWPTLIYRFSHIKLPFCRSKWSNIGNITWVSQKPGPPSCAPLVVLNMIQLPDSGLAGPVSKREASSQPAKCKGCLFRTAEGNKWDASCPCSLFGSRLRWFMQVLLHGSCQTQRDSASSSTGGPWG